MVPFVYWFYIGLGEIKYLFNVVKVYMPLFNHVLYFQWLLVSKIKTYIKANFAPFVVQMAISVLNLALSCNAAFVTPISGPWVDVKHRLDSCKKLFWGDTEFLEQ